ncbi:hypothetical protein C471_02240 [Halorubrum saccharovorum DSM 1137]|uniref:Methanogenesis regulatory protein FilR1 middle domain-containing protein n=1 Tax=Halorubrum saccharovorum DSM 1137 TaxID=1227484 RepID=M0E8R3_9EURY|nr:hypothetical protein [Halorubrum saccharovorum]ELZ42774.1 hypothetical protein C471_02240 [Halorubrum saccharovorum DSM 1137]
MADGDTAGTVLRRLVAEAVGVEETDRGALAADLAERGDDPGPAARLSALVGPGDSLVGVVPRVDPALARRLLGNADGRSGGTIRLAFTGQAANRLTSASGTLVQPILAEYGVDAYRHDGDSPIGVLLVDDRAVVGLFDEGGLAALLWSDAPEVREWAAETCRRYLSAADPV